MSEYFEMRSPLTEESLGKVRTLASTELKTHLKKAADSFPSWAKDLQRRKKALRAFASQMESRKSELAKKITEEMGKPISQSESEIEKCLSLFDYYENEAEALMKGRLVGEDGRILPQASGLIFGVMPWNFPYWQSLRLAVPNLYLGNVIVIKPAESVFSSSKILESLATETLGEYVFQVLAISHQEVETAISSDYTRGVSLTGSSRAGKAIAELAGRHLKPSVFELGGNDPYIVLEDADISLAAKKCAQSRLQNSGQSCIAAKRFIVDSKIYEHFLKALVEEFKTYRIGDPFLSETQIGPLARCDLRDQLKKQVEDSLEKGARLVWSSDFSSERGFFYPPQILDQVRPGQPAFDDELFGPVASVIKANSEDEAVELANQSCFGLGSAVFSQSRERAFEVGLRLNIGMLAINDFVRSRADLPFGGLKESGFGRELSSEGFLEFANLKTVIG